MTSLGCTARCGIIRYAGLAQAHIQQRCFVLSHSACSNALVHSPSLWEGMHACCPVLQQQGDDLEASSSCQLLILPKSFVFPFLGSTPI